MSLHSEAKNLTINVLLIEDNVGYATILQKRLSRLTNPSFHIEHADRLQSGLEILARGETDVVLLDLFLPDSEGSDTFASVRLQAPAVPIVVLTGLDDEAIGLEMVRNGAQDYLTKNQLSDKVLSQSLRYAVARHRMAIKMLDLSLIDELTGLQSRRGFFALSKQQLKLAKRTKRSMLLIFIDLDGLKKINDTHGHEAGDQALIQVANVLRATFRNSDVMARIGGDEFALLAIEARADSAEILLARLEEKLKDWNGQNNLKFKLSLSSGVAHFDPSNPCSLEELITNADKAMHKHKRCDETSAPPRLGMENASPDKLR